MTCRRRIAASRCTQRAAQPASRSGHSGSPRIVRYSAGWPGCPEPKRQPNLVFAAARWHGLAAPAPYADLRRALLGDTGRISGTILERATQTNEVGRLATLVPAFASVPGDGPVGLLEVGASAGLCLYPDRWSYAWTTDHGTVTAGSAIPTLAADVSGPAALPDDVPEVVWRGGIDLNPLDAADPDTCRWLLTLVWPEHEDRRARLEKAWDIARREPPDLRRGDLLRELPGLVAEARAALPDGGRLLVFHSAVIAYLDVPGRRAVRRPDAGPADRSVPALGQQRAPACASGCHGDRTRAAARTLCPRCRRPVPSVTRTSTAAACTGGTRDEAVDGSLASRSGARPGPQQPRRSLCRTPSFVVDGPRRLA